MLDLLQNISIILIVKKVVKKMKKLKDITKEELETMPFDDIAYLILKEKGKKMKTAEIFEIIKNLLEMSESEYEARIGDFFTLLSTEKRFLQLEQGYWDLRENHTAKIEIEEDEDEEEIEEEIEQPEIEEDDDIFLSETKEADDDEAEDELKDLVVLDDENEGDL